MYFATLALVLAFWILNLAVLVEAGIYVLKPATGSTCRAGRICTIEWVDDGIQPLLPAAGLCTFGLYHGEQKLVQAITPADVSQTHSITFKPISAAGPNSGAYYIGITSTVIKDNSSTPYMAFSPYFIINGMTGSFDTPLAEATASIPLPPSLETPTSQLATATSDSTTALSTITVGTLSTSLPPLPIPTNKPVTSKASSQSSSQSLTKLSTSLLSTSASIVSSTGTPAPVSTAASNSALRLSSQPMPIFITLLVLSLLSRFSL